MSSPNAVQTEISDVKHIFPYGNLQKMTALLVATFLQVCVSAWSDNRDTALTFICGCFRFHFSYSGHAVERQTW